MANRHTKSKPQRVTDVFAIYYSKKDKCWIAHSLRTDQFGTGDSLVDALVDGMKAVDQVVALAKKQPKVKLFCDAPAEIQQIAKNAKRLPYEVYEIAYKKLYGNWPKDLEVEFKPHECHSFSISSKRFCKEIHA